MNSPTATISQIAVNAAQTQHSENSPAIQQVQKSAQELIAKLVLPSKKNEHWKYSSLLHLDESLFQASASTPEQTPSLDLPGLDGWRVVISNGQILPELSVLPEQSGIHCCLLSQVSDEQRALLGQHIDFDKFPFAALNQASFIDGISIQVEKNITAEKPLHIVYLNQASKACEYSRLFIQLGDNAQANIIEHYLSTDKNSLSNSTTEIMLAAQARLTHYRLQLDGNAHIGNVHSIQERDSQLHSFQLMLGSQFLRNDIHSILNDTGAHQALNGVYLSRDQQHIDNHVTLEHRAPHCTSDQLYKGIVAEQSRAVFNGRIHIHEGAIKTHAELSNKNLLLSNQAEIDTKPELEIYNDDVRCAHGTTVGQLDPTAIAYLQSRGISKADAKLMLSFGFVHELLNNMPNQTLADWLRPRLNHFLRELEQ